MGEISTAERRTWFAIVGQGFNTHFRLSTGNLLVSSCPTTRGSQLQWGVGAVTQQICISMYTDMYISFAYRKDNRKFG